MYDGTLATKGPWEALVTFQQMIILADQHGVVDMTPDAIDRRTTIPLKIIQKGLESLEAADKDSRSPNEEGRRILRLSASREWGWQIVNYAHYRNLRSAEERRAYHRQYYHLKRKGNSTTLSTPISTLSTDSTEAVSSKHKQESKALSGKPDLKQSAIEILNFLNDKTGKKFEPLPANIEPIIARLKESSIEDIRCVIALKCREWIGDEKMAQYLRPATLFNRTKFAQYQGELK